jgi:uncharacterized protein (TIGR00369 family)
VYLAQTEHAWLKKYGSIPSCDVVGKGFVLTQFEPRNPDFRAFVERYVAAQGYLKLIGVAPARIDPGEVVFRIDYRPEVGQQNGVFHGGVIGSVAEAVMGAAAATLAPAGHNVVGAEYKVNLLSPAAGPTLLAHGHVLKSGRRLIVCRADISFIDADGQATLCAIAQGAMAVVPSSSP